MNRSSVGLEPISVILFPISILNCFFKIIGNLLSGIPFTQQIFTKNLLYAKLFYLGVLKYSREMGISLLHESVP